MADPVSSSAHLLTQTGGHSHATGTPYGDRLLRAGPQVLRCVLPIWTGGTCLAVAGWISEVRLIPLCVSLNAAAAGEATVYTGRAFPSAIASPTTAILIIQKDARFVNREATTDARVPHIFLCVSPMRGRGFHSTSLAI